MHFQHASIAAFLIDTARKFNSLAAFKTGQMNSCSTACGHLQLRK